MIHILICEDNFEHRQTIEQIINSYIMIEELDMKIALSTQSPNILLDHLKEHSYTGCLYFLDVDLKNELDGIRLGSKIRIIDPTSKIVIVTSHSELMPLTFQYKVEAMDYVIKGDIESMKNRIQKCIRQAIKLMQSESRARVNDRMAIKIGTQQRFFQLHEIICIKTIGIAHKLELTTFTGKITFYGKLSYFEEFSEKMVRIHHGYVINTDNIDSINLQNREILMTNGEMCYLSVRGIKKIKSFLSKYV